MTLTLHNGFSAFRPNPASIAEQSAKTIATRNLEQRTTAELSLAESSNASLSSVYRGVRDPISLPPSGLIITPHFEAIEGKNPNGILICQPRVARHELPWVCIDEVSSTLKGLTRSYWSVPHVSFLEFDLVTHGGPAEP